MRKTPEQRKAELNNGSKQIAIGLRYQMTIFSAVDQLVNILQQMNCTNAAKQRILQNSLNYIQQKIEELETDAKTNP